MRKTLKQKNNRWILLSKAFGLAALCGLLIFTTIKFKSSWRGPYIELDYPVTGITIQDPILLVSGTTYNVAQLFVYNSPIPIQLKTNRFATELSVPIGVSSVVLDGYTRSGKHTRLSILVHRTQPDPNKPLSPNIELLQRLNPTETPFRATSDILDNIQTIIR